MIQYNSLNVKLSNSQLSKLKSAIDKLQVFVKLLPITYQQILNCQKLNFQK